VDPILKSWSWKNCSNIQNSSLYTAIANNVEFLYRAVSLLKLLHIITLLPPAIGLFFQRTYTQLGSIQPRSVLQATQTQIPSLPARYPFNTWVRWGKETYLEPHADSGIPTWKHLKVSKQPEPLHLCGSFKQEEDN
jgi:hypothetical protein